MMEEIAVFEEWMGGHSRDIERLAFQYGCSPEQAAQLAEETFRVIYNDQEKMDEGKLYIYKIALDKFEHVQQTDSSQDIILPFEEDQQLHEKINKLEEKTKLSLILSQFHNMSEVEIATVVGISEDAVREAIRQAIQQLTIEIGDSNLDKRMEFLRKSYGRISSSFRIDQIFATPTDEIRIPDKKKQTVSKNVLILWVVGILTLLALVIVQVVTGEEYQKTSAEKYIEQLKESFEEEIASRYAQLGLIETTEANEFEYQYDHLYGKQARKEFEFMVEKEKNEYCRYR